MGSVALSSASVRGRGTFPKGGDIVRTLTTEYPDQTQRSMGFGGKRTEESVGGHHGPEPGTDLAPRGEGPETPLLPPVALGQRGRLDVARAPPLPPLRGQGADHHRARHCGCGESGAESPLLAALGPGSRMAPPLPAHSCFCCHFKSSAGWGGDSCSPSQSRQRALPEHLPATASCRRAALAGRGHGRRPPQSNATRVPQGERGRPPGLLPAPWRVSSTFAGEN